MALLLLALVKLLLWSFLRLFPDKKPPSSFAFSFYFVLIFYDTLADDLWKTQFLVISWVTLYTWLEAYKVNKEDQNSIWNMTARLVWPYLFFCKHLSLVVNKQDQRTMKTAIKYFWPFGRFRIEGQKLSSFLLTKYIKIQSYQNSWSPFLYSSMKKNQFLT